MAVIDLSNAEREQVEDLRGRVEAFEDTYGSQFRTTCNRRYRDYRSFRRDRHDWVKAGPNDRDGVMLAQRRDWGANIHVPIAYETVETLAPMAVAQQPKMLYLPRNPEAEPNLLFVRLMIDAQQENIDFDLRLQDTLKNGFIYGIGVGKTYWKTEYRTERQMAPSIANMQTGGQDYALGQPRQRLCFDDPCYESVDPYDFLWDMYGSDIETCKWVAHRRWLGLSDCLERIDDGRWNTPAAQRLTEDDLRRMGSSQRYDEVWQERMEASGFGSFQARVDYAADGKRGEQIHELLEIHTRERVWCLLDREITVMDAESACPGHLPFQIFRPTKLPGQMIGISEIEPIEHLCRELDILRSQRRDSATLALCGGYAFDSGMMDEEDLVFGPAAAIEVRGDPRMALMPLEIKPPPGTSYQEEAAILSDIQRASGLNDALAGGDGGSINTATEAQLVQSGLSKRIGFKSRRFEAEHIRPIARTFLALNQRNIRTQRDVREQLPLDPENPNVARWRWWKIGPGELMGEYEITPEGGSMQARNVPMEMQRAQMLMQAFNGNPHIDQRLLYNEVLRLMQVEQPQQWMTQQPPPIPPEALQLLEKGGVRKNLIDAAVQTAQRADPMIPPAEADPGAQQALSDGAQPAMNGAAA